MATNDNASLLSKVVSFVSSPVLRKSATNDASQTSQESADKASIQAMMDRKLHNDVVRKREFELLRQMRRREPQVNRIDMNDRTSLFPTSILSRAGGRAQTIKKIDEIEQQMSQQWWKGKQIKAAFQVGKPVSAPALPTEPEVEAPPAKSADLPFTPPQVEDDTVQGRLEASLYDEPPVSGAADFVPTQVNQFAHDPEIEDAAILFANGDYEGAAQSLLGLLRDGESDVQGEQEDIWMVLFDLYRVTGDRTRFDGAAIDFAARFGRSAPQWGTSLEVAQHQVAPEIPVLSAGKGTDVTVPATLGPVALNKLKATLEKGVAPWRLNWSQLVTVEDAVVPELARLFSDWCSSKVQLRFTGAKRLDELLRDATAAGNPEVPPEWWLWRLHTLRLGHREDEFELVALDYCITYEMSPPAWEPPVCDFRSSESDATDAAPKVVAPLVIGDELLSTLAGTFSPNTPGSSGFHNAEFGPDPALNVGRFGLVELSAEVLGDASQALEKLDRGRVGFSKLVVDCRHLVRVDFAAAGGLLNWTSARTAEGCKVEFKNVNRLVATFFSVIGIDEFARIISPAR